MQRIETEISTIQGMLESNENREIKNKKLRDYIDSVSFATLTVVYMGNPSLGIIAKKLRETNTLDISLWECFYVLDYFYKGTSTVSTPLREAFDKIKTYMHELFPQATISELDQVVQSFLRGSRMRRDSPIFCDMFQGCDYSQEYLLNHYINFCTENNWNKSDANSLLEEIKRKK